MTMSKAFRIGKYPSVLALDTSSVDVSTHERAWEIFMTRAWFVQSELPSDLRPV